MNSCRPNFHRQNMSPQARSTEAQPPITIQRSTSNTGSGGLSGSSLMPRDLQKSDNREN
jgi:hypothetical protein